MNNNINSNNATSSTTTTTTPNNNSNSNNNNNSNSNNSSQRHHQRSPLSPAVSSSPVITGSPLDGPADCTLACDEGHLTAHKIMLCAHSKYLQDILSKFPNAEHPIIILTELNITDIKILVNYMYTGELVIANDGSPSSLLRAAQILKIDSLTDFDDEDDQNNNLPAYQSHHHQQHNNNNSNNNSLSNNRSHLHLSSTNIINNSNNNYRHLHPDDQSLSPTPSPSPPPPPHQPMQLPQQLAPPLPPQLIKSTTTSSHLNLTHSRRSHIQKQPQPPQSRQQQQQQNHHHQAQQQQNHHHHHHHQISNLTKDSNNKIRCHLCNIGLSDVKCLYRHVLTRHLPEKWGYKCEFCDREFSRDDHLMRHYTTKHKNMEFNREKIRETRRLNREMAKNFHDQISKIGGLEGLEELESIKDELDL